jgi:hypothetical protein
VLLIRVDIMLSTNLVVNKELPTGIPFPSLVLFSSIVDPKLFSFDPDLEPDPEVEVMDPDPT